MQHLPEVTADDAAVGADLLDGADGLHRISNGLVETRDHRLAVGSDLNTQIAKLLHFIEQEFVQFQQRMVERCAHADLLGKPRQRQKFLKIGMAKADADFFLHSHFHDLFHFRQDLAVLAAQAHAFVLRMTSTAPETVGGKRREPDHLEVRILESHADIVGPHAEAHADAAEDLHGISQLAPGDHVVYVALMFQWSLKAIARMPHLDASTAIWIMSWERCTKSGKA